MWGYRDKTALITGGGSGIGLGLAQALVERGTHVALLGTGRERLDAAVAGLMASGGRAIGVTLDVTDGSGWPAVVEDVEAQLGPIDILVLNAGAQGGRKPIEEVSWEEWRWQWDVNVHGIYHGLHAVLPGMKRRAKPAQILITASIAALFPRPRVTAYGPSKAAALALGEALQLELTDGPISVSVLCPALVRSSMDETMRRHAPDPDEGTYAFMTAALSTGLDPLAVGRYTLDMMAKGHFYVFTHPETLGRVAPRLDAIRSAFAAQAEAGAILAKDNAICDPPRSLYRHKRYF